MNSSPPVAGSLWVNPRPLVVALAGALLSLIFLSFYLGGEARGRMDFLVLPAAQWGVPPSLAAHGSEPLYLDPRESGWDGQFYFRMANDPLGTGDSPAHIDSPSYRYQRIGMSGTAWLLSQISFRNWVSPCLFYLTSLLALFVATWALAAYSRRAGGSPWLALLWSLGLGTQLTLLNGLPDGFAEAMVVISVLSLASSRPSPVLYSLCMTLGVLSREAYVAAAGLIAVIHMLRLFQGEEVEIASRAQAAAAGGWAAWFSKRLRTMLSMPALAQTIGHGLCMGIPLAAFATWQIYIRVHFGKAPSEQAGGVLAPFLEQFVRFFKAALAGNHPIWGQNVPLSHRELVMLIVFAALLLLFFASAVVVIWRTRSFRNPAILVLAFAPVIVLYFFFGQVVMMHYSGYLKAANIVLFLVPFTILSLPLPTGVWRHTFLGLTVACGLAGSAQFWDDKVLGGSWKLGRPATLYEYGHYHGGVHVTNGQPVLSSFASTVTMVGSSSFYTREIFRELRGLPEMRVFEVDVTNQGKEAYALAEGVGAVRLSYHFLSVDGTAVIQDGLRTFFQKPLEPGQTRRLHLYVEYPAKPGDYLLRISLVQEGVSWFYQQGTGYADFQVTVR